MSAPNSPDEPSFDIVQFEVAAQARAAEFVGQVTRLAKLAILGSEFLPDESWLSERGAQYDLADGSQIAVKHETYDQDPARIKAKLRVTQPPQEFLGSDRQLRRVTLSRLVMYTSFMETLDDNAVQELEKTLPPAPQELEEKFREFEVAVHADRMEDQMRPQYQPSELILARSATLVERKLPNGPNFSTERYSPAMPPDTRLAHTAARRRAGESVVDPEYTIAEHTALIAQLKRTNPRSVKPQPLDRYFDEFWQDPPATIRSWQPKK